MWAHMQGGCHGEPPQLDCHKFQVQGFFVRGLHATLLHRAPLKMVCAWDRLRTITRHDALVKQLIGQIAYGIRALS